MTLEQSGREKRRSMVVEFRRNVGTAKCDHVYSVRRAKSDLVMVEDDQQHDASRTSTDPKVTKKREA